MKIVCAVIAAIAVLSGVAAGESWEADDKIFEVYDAENNLVTRVCYAVCEGDEYIAGDDTLYRIVEVGDGRAKAERVEGENDIQAFNYAPVARAEANKLICMYSTHSDESYEPTDGAASKESGAGIYDVGAALKEQLEQNGITVEYSEETFLPHDAGAYRRSRSTAQEMLKEQPAAIFDLHRDGIPDPDEYEQNISGEDASKVRLLVGRSNANSDANRAFAKQIKSVADEKYPELIKDIYIGKGNYNQELYPKSLLLEFGTHTIDKDRAIASTKYVSDVVTEVLFGDTAKAESTGRAETKSAWTGIGWLLGIAALAAIVYALINTGSFKGMTEKIKRGASEMTGGMIGKKPDKDEK